MSDEEAKVPTLKEFLDSRVLPVFVAAVADAEREFLQAQKELDELRGGAGTICWRVADDAPFYFNFADGKALIEPKPASEPVLTFRMSADDWRRFAGGVAGGFLAGGNRRGLGKSRLEKLKPLRGTVRFVLTGLPDGDWSADLALNGEPADLPTATIRMPSEVASEIQTGKLNPQMAFMQGKVKMLGDAGLVMQLGMAMLL